MARAFLSNPRWPQLAAVQLEESGAVPWPAPYHRVAPSGAELREYATVKGADSPPSVIA